MVPQCYMLCLYVYGQQYGQLNNSCSFCCLFCSVLSFKNMKIGIIDVAAVFN